ncbi:MAG: acyl carrier protein [Bryobacteraceae bacterium]|jgi:acyl carrier protein|nr:acyl carrier protein [Bryobacteraceae bacterium]
MPEDLTARVIAIVAKTTHKPIEAFAADSSFESLGIDSLDGIQILFALEQEFDISIPDDEAKKIRGIADVVEGVGKLIDAKQG